MKKLILGAFIIFSTYASADLNSLQRGAKIYMNYCAGCHSLKYMRYKQLAEGLELEDKVLFENLVFTKAKLYSPITNNFSSIYASKWFGVAPPDLSLTIRARGSDFVSKYLQSFYIDNKRPFGTNNLIIPNTNMPNVLEVLSGTKIFLPNKKILIPHNAGTMSEQEFESTITDLVSFLSFVSEPHKKLQERLGIIVLLFLLLLFLLLLRIFKKIQHS